LGFKALLVTARFYRRHTHTLHNFSLPLHNFSLPLPHILATHITLYLCCAIICERFMLLGPPFSLVLNKKYMLCSGGVAAAVALSPLSQGMSLSCIVELSAAYGLVCSRDYDLPLHTHTQNALLTRTHPFLPSITLEHAIHSFTHA
jgi:hypothetical protein